jgi:hypothetical protein
MTASNASVIIPGYSLYKLAWFLPGIGFYICNFCSDKRGVGENRQHVDGHAMPLMPICFTKSLKHAKQLCRISRELNEGQSSQNGSHLLVISYMRT